MRRKFIANIFQKPKERPPIVILFKGKQGTGKMYHYIKTIKKKSTVRCFLGL